MSQDIPRPLVCRPFPLAQFWNSAGAAYIKEFQEWNPALAPPKVHRSKFDDLDAANDERLSKYKRSDEQYSGHEETQPHGRK